MSILIKGMEMPKSCGECAIKSWDGEDDVCPFSGISALSIGRQDDCPLVPVPPHGRLIDADELVALVYANIALVYANIALFDSTSGRLGADQKLVREWLRSMVDNINKAPTIIPAEEGET